MANKEYRVECSTHGTSPGTFVCQHLKTGENLGFHLGYDPDNPDSLYPDAWCDECEQVLEREGEWTDVAADYANIQLVCSHCYMTIRQKNWCQDQQKFEDLAQESIQHLQALQGAMSEEYKLGEYERWDWDQDTSQLVFSHAGQAKVICDIQFVGSLSTASNTWMWAWANESLSTEIKNDSKIMLQLGESENFMQLACPIWPGDEYDGWSMTAIMASRCNAIGAYRTPSENGFTYMIITKATRVS